MEDQALQEVGIDMEETDLFITHLHTDHSGLVQHLSPAQQHRMDGQG